MFFETLAECIDAMSWQGDIPIENRSPVVRRDEDGKIFCAPIKPIRVDGAGSTNAIVKYAADVANIHRALLPWKLELQIRPGRVRAHTSRSPMSPWTTRRRCPATSPDYQGHSDNSAGWVALTMIADRSHADGDQRGYLLAYMAASGDPEWRPAPNRGDSGINES
jgi:hypothetical protein